MQKKLIEIFAATILMVLLLTANLPPASAADTLKPSDFNLESWSKTVDFFDYAREHAAAHGKIPPTSEAHAYVYLTYVNTSGLRMFYAGLANITVNHAALSIPIQTVMMHYKSKDGLKDVVTTSSFLMLLAFNETVDTAFPNSPDRNDTLYASFSLGCDLTQYFGSSTPPALSSKTEIIPLTSTPDKLSWHWGMRYTNLTAIWWKVLIDPENPSHDPRPIAISRYDKLTFTYNLTINPENNEATLTMNYVIGKMTDLWVFWWFIFIPFPVHFNATGSYFLNGAKHSNETIYEFLQNKGINMSIVQFQNTVILDHTVYVKSQGGANVTDNDVFVTDTSISTFADDNEKVFEANFGVKKTYNLYNYTADPTETTFKTYNVTTRTCKVAGFADNPIFAVHTSLLRLLPLVLAHMDSQLYEQAKHHLLDMSYADCFYIIAYPIYSGYRIKHDPTYTAYCSLTTGQPSTPPPTLPIGGLTLILLILVAVAAVALASIAILRRKRRTPTLTTLR